MVNSLAILTNFIGLIVSFWLGVYIITNNRRSWVGWTSGITLWALAGLFANLILTIFPDPAPAYEPIWVRLIFPFWPHEPDSQNITVWTQGLAACMGVIFWYHTTLLILSKNPQGWQRFSLVLAYTLGITAVFLQTYQPAFFTVLRADPQLIDTQQFGLPFLFFASFLILYSGLSVRNLIHAYQQNTSIIVKKQLNMLIAASLAASLAAVLTVAGSIPGAYIPVYWVSLLLLCAVCFFVYGVARYSALLEHRILRRDIIYSGVTTGLVILLYLGLFLWLKVAYDVQDGIIVFLIPLVILSHSTIEGVRRLLERFIYDRRTQALRASLDDLIRLAGEQADLNEMLSHYLETICIPIRATYGVVLVFENEIAHPTGVYRWHDGRLHLPSKNLLAGDVKPLEPGSLPDPYLDVTLLIPLYSAEQQIGALLLGHPENGIHYSSEDLLLLQDPSERVAELIIQSRRITNYIDQFVQLPMKHIQTSSDLIPVQWVEEALQNFYNYSFLGDSPLINLKQVKKLLSAPAITYLDRGKAVHQVVFEAVEKLRPQTIVPKEPFPREWFSYLILHDAYIEGLPNRDIIAKLYVSEGTFHRTRRSALRSVTRVLGEFELAQG